MHQLIGHVGICHCLDCWQVHTANKKGYDSLNTFTTSNPTFDDLKAMAKEMVHIYVATHRLQRMHRKPMKEHNLQITNALLLNKYFLLYKKLSHAINNGNITQVEMFIVSWIPILKAIGKHKYVTHMTNFLINIHFVYPAGLRSVTDPLSTY